MRKEMSVYICAISLCMSLMCVGASKPLINQKPQSGSSTSVKSQPQETPTQKPPVTRPSQKTVSSDILTQTSTFTAAPTLTFLDTLNAGAEYTLTDEMFATAMPALANATDTIPKGKKIASNGFRIQLMVATDAELVKPKQKSWEAEFNLKVYIRYLQPYYKVFIGDFTNRQSADEALTKIKQAGYADAWIIKSDVFVDE